jgi:GGDEF domain-containing protein
MFLHSILAAPSVVSSCVVKFSSLSIHHLNDDIEALDQKIGPSFADLSVNSKLALLGMCSAYNQANLLDSGSSIIQELVGTNGLGLISLINPVSKVPGRLFAQRLIQFFHQSGVNFHYYFIDLMALKAGNDLSQHGQEGGDMLLERFVMLLQEEVAKQDPTAVVSHIGGDEFLVIVPSCNPIDMDSIKDTIAKADNTDIVDPSNIKVMKTFYNSRSLFNGTDVEQFTSTVTKELNRRQLEFQLCYLNTSLRSLSRFHNIVYAFVYFLFYKLPKVLTFRFKRDTDIDWVMNQDCIKRIASQELPPFRIRFCSYYGTVHVSSFDSFKPLMEFINYAPLLKVENRETKEKMWTAKDGKPNPEVKYLDLRGEHRLNRKVDFK